MKIIVTGATGHIGNNFVRQAVEIGFDVTCIVRRSGSMLDTLPCQVITGNLFDQNFLFNNISHGDTVVHSVGYIDLTDKKREECYRVNLDLTRLIAKVCLERGAHLIYIGTVDAIIKNGIDTITEPGIYYPERISGNYSKSKAEATNFLLKLIKEHPDFLCDIVLPTAVIGPHDYKPSAVGKIIKSVLRGMPELGIVGGYNFVDVRDVADVLITLVNHPQREEFIISGESVSVEKLYKKINKIMGYKRRPIILPQFLARPFLNKTILRTLVENPRYCSEKAKEKLSFSPTPFDKTLSDTINFFLKY